MMYSSMKKRMAKKYMLKNKKWIYRGEGNANLVLALVKERKILRLRKSHPNEGTEMEEERIWREYDFCKAVMIPLLGSHVVPVPTIVQLEPSELAELNESLMPLRPRHRRNKGLYASYAAIFTDLCSLPDSFPSFWGPTYCVELKPKQGWVPYPDRRLSTCTFCLNQYSKLKHGKINEKTQYCPLDLFSGNKNRMKRAIIALLKCPQNNLKMFKNGSLVFGDSTSGGYESVLTEWFGCYDADSLVDNFTNMITEMLTSDLCESENQKLFDEIPLCSIDIGSEASNRSLSAGKIPKYLIEEAQSLLSGPTCYADSESLPRNCILSKILQIQKLDILGSDAVEQLYAALLFKDDYDYVYDLFASLHNIYKPINSYLLATTAKDCSILMSFQRVPINAVDYESYIKDVNNVHYAFNVGVSDLDPKPMSSIGKHRKRDYDAILNCIEILRSES